MSMKEGDVGRRRVLALIGATALAGCAPRSSEDRPLDLFAAASLREVLDAAAAQYDRSSGRRVRAT